MCKHLGEPTYGKNASYRFICYPLIPTQSAGRLSGCARRLQDSAEQEAAEPKRNPGALQCSSTARTQNSTDVKGPESIREHTSVFRFPTVQRSARPEQTQYTGVPEQAQRPARAKRKKTPKKTKPATTDQPNRAAQSTA